VDSRLRCRSTCPISGSADPAASRSLATTPILATIGGMRLRELTVDDVHQALAAMALRYSSAAVAMGHNALTRAIRHTEARDLVRRNVAMLVDTPKGQAGRPSKSLSLDQAFALLKAAEGTRMHAYIALCLATGIRTEEARALRWEHVDLGDPVAGQPGPASAAVWRSVRSHGDTKTEKSRRTLPYPRWQRPRCGPTESGRQATGPPPE
jgi:integrase